MNRIVIARRCGSALLVVVVSLPMAACGQAARADPATVARGPAGATSVPTITTVTTQAPVTSPDAPSIGTIVTAAPTVTAAVTSPADPLAVAAQRKSKKGKQAVPPPTTPPTTLAAAPAPAYEVTVWPPFTPAGPLDGVAALTGEPAGSDVTHRPALAVKIDNSRRARPQWEIDAADVIFEENVEGITRFIAVFHTRLPSMVGPVRSARTSDLPILAAMNRPILAWSGGNPAVTAEVRAAADAGVIVDLSALRVGCYRRQPGRSAPHNLVLDPACAHARAAGAPARPLWTYASEWDAGTAAYGPDSTFHVPMDGVHVTWEWDVTQARYLRSQEGAPHLAANGTRIAATNVVTLYVPHVPSRADGRSPEAITVGTGQLMVHRDGVATAGTWERSGPYEPFTVRDGDGREIALRPGTTFVHLARGP